MPVFVLAKHESIKCFVCDMEVLKGQEVYFDIEERIYYCPGCGLRMWADRKESEAAEMLKPATKADIARLEAVITELAKLIKERI